MRLKTAFLIIVAGMLIAASAFAWDYIHRSPSDLSHLKPELVLDFETAMKLAEQNPGALKDKTLMIKGMIRDIKREAGNLTLELGSNSSPSSVTCQVDARHTEELREVSKGKTIGIKGRVSAVVTDESSLFGNTIQMNYCTIN